MSACVSKMVDAIGLYDALQSTIQRYIPDPHINIRSHLGEDNKENSSRKSPRRKEKFSPIFLILLRRIIEGRIT